MNVAELARAVTSGDRRALGKAITLIESSRRQDERDAEALLEKLATDSKRAIRVGISGVPGVGKSTFIEALGIRLVDSAKRVAVLAVDPSSARTGGSILGDKTRMPRLAASERAFIRPSPTSGTLGGVARRTRETIAICEAAGFDVVLVETVGVGQAELAVGDMVDVVLLLLLAGAGDELQGIKRGIMELADVVAINKADGDNLEPSRRAAAEVTGALGLLRSSPPEVLLASAIEDRGIDEVWQALLVARGRVDLSAKHQAQNERWFWALLREGLEHAFLARRDVQAMLPGLRARVAGNELTAAAAARKLLGLLEA